jgi:hypothetical protein
MSALRAIAARRVSWAAAATIAVAAAGCSAPVTHRPRVGYVRVESLVALHPSYRQLAALDRWAAAARRASGARIAPVPAPAGRTFAATPGEPLPLPPVDSVLARVNRATAEEITELTADLRARMADELARSTRDAIQAARALSAPQRTEIIRRSEDERREILLDSRLPITNMRLQVANLEFQLTRPQLTAEQKARVQTQLQDVRAKLEAAVREQSDRLEAVQHRYDVQLTAIDQAAADEAAREVVGVRERLAKELDSELERERARLTAPATGAAEQMTAGLQLPEVAPLTEPPGPLSLAAEQAAAAVRRNLSAWSSAMTTDSAELATIRRDLADAIAGDTRATIETLAQAHHWRIVWEQPKRGRVEDITDRAQKWVRDYWHG